MERREKIRIMSQKENIKFAFLGTPQLSAEILEHLKIQGFLPSIIITNPDRPQGRKMVVTPTPVKMWAIKNGIQYLQPENLKDSNFIEKLSVDFELFVVVAYGKILSKEILSIPKKGTLNIHYSLLPKYRGASPIESAILNDDRNTGVSILLLDEKMDHGPIVAMERLNLTSQMPEFAWPLKASELRSQMNQVAGKLLSEVIPKWMAGEINAIPQNHDEATYTKKFEKEDGLLDLTADPYKNFLKINAFDDSIGTYFFAEKNDMKIRVIVKDAKFESGRLTLVSVVPEGKKEMPYEVFKKTLN
ncbi:MAG: methionyl-tRNA formyltransferase [Candidatus Taylorbacteria bacterium]|nr:methionyl-tRNA formyltransferase [Candidatus Taylorbacteria bacterium]